MSGEYHPDSLSSLSGNENEETKEIRQARWELESAAEQFAISVANFLEAGGSQMEVIPILQKIAAPQ